MSITKRKKLLVETWCDLCGQSGGTSLLDPDEYPTWLKNMTDLLTFEVDGKPRLLCWACIRKGGLVKEYDRRLTTLTYPKEKAK